MQNSTFVKAFVSIWLVPMLVVLIISNPAYASSKKEQPLRIATAPVGGIVYVFGAAISELLANHGGPKLEVLPQYASSGYLMFPTKECDLAIGANDELMYVYTGTNVYEKLTKGKGIDARVLMLGTTTPAGQVVTGDSGIKTYNDLRGKKVVLVFGSSLALNEGAKAALYAGGLTEKDVKVVKAAGVPAAARMVIEGKADACYGSVGVPVFREIAAARKGARHLSILNTPETRMKIHEMSPAYFPMQIKAGPLTVPEDIYLVGRNQALTARSDLPDDVAYTITKLIWEYYKELGPKQPQLKTWTKEQFVSTRACAPYHPGAIRFYKEVGAWTPEVEEHNNELLDIKKK